MMNRFHHGLRKERLAGPVTVAAICLLLVAGLVEARVTGLIYYDAFGGRDFLNGSPESNDPVVTSQGEFTHAASISFLLGGPDPLGFIPKYGSYVGISAAFDSIYGPTDGPMGANWVHNHLIFLKRVDSTNVIVYYDGGKVIFFSKAAGVWTMSQPSFLFTYKGTPYQLVEEGTKLKMMDPEVNRIFVFEIAGLSSGVRGVESVHDRSGNTHAYTYNPDGTLSRVADGLGRTLDFSYTSSGGSPRVTRVTDQTGRSIVFAYAGAFLSSITSARGKTTTYTYDGSGLLLTITQPAGNTTVRNEYSLIQTFAGAVLGVVAQTDGVGNRTRMSYAAGSTTITDALGNSRVHQFNNEARITGLVDESGKRIQYEYDNFHRRTATVDRLGERSSITYDSASGKITSRTDADGKIRRYTYSAQSQEGFTFYNLTRLDVPDGASEEFAYDARGNLTTRRDRAGKLWNYTYNGRGQLTDLTSPTGATTTLAHNTDGTPASMRDPAGNFTTYGYDALKRLNRTTHADGTAVQTTFDNDDNVISVTNERGKTTTYAFDDNGNLARQTDALGNAWTYAYDGNDQVIRITDPLGKTAAATYDALRRTKTMTDPNANATTLSYDFRGRMTSMVDPEGKTWSMAYDDEGVVASITNPLGKIWRYTSDKLGRIRSVTDPLSNVARNDFDALDRLISQTNPAGETVTYGFDARGLVTRAALPEQITATYTRNDLGEVEQITDPRGKFHRRTYDILGRLTSYTDPLGNARRFSYDNRHRKSRVELPLGNLDLVYGPTDLPTSLTYSDGTRLDSAYDDDDRLTTANGVAMTYDNAGRIAGSNGISVTLDNGGRITSMTLAPNRTLSYGYDRRNMPVSVTDWAGAITRLAYDDAGRLLTITRPNGVVTTFGYDDADRLIRKTDSRGTTTQSSIALIPDGAGRTREATRNAPLAPSLTQGTSNLDVNDGGQVQGYAYDTMGRLMSGGGRTYRWDLASRLSSYVEGQRTASFAYDAFGNPLSRTQAGRTRSYVWNLALGLPSISIIRDGAATTRYYVHLADGRLLYSIEESDNARRYYHYDEMGNTSFLTDDSGKVSDSYAYTPLGRVTGSTGTTDNPFTYLGEFGVMREPGTTLYHMGARYYDSAARRFLSRDPMGVDLGNPLSFDAYEYAPNNSLSRLTPAGGKEKDPLQPKPGASRVSRLGSVPPPASLTSVGLLAEEEEERTIEPMGLGRESEPALTAEEGRTAEAEEPPQEREANQFHLLCPKKLCGLGTVLSSGGALVSLYGEFRVAQYLTFANGVDAHFNAITAGITEINQAGRINAAYAGGSAQNAAGYVRQTGRSIWYEKNTVELYKLEQKAATAAKVAKVGKVVAGVGVALDVGATIIDGVSHGDSNAQIAFDAGAVAIGDVAVNAHPLLAAADVGTLGLVSGGLTNAIRAPVDLPTVYFSDRVTSAQQERYRQRWGRKPLLRAAMWLGDCLYDGIFGKY